MKTLTSILCTCALCYFMGLGAFLASETIEACARERTTQVRIVSESQVIAALDQTRREIELAKTRQPQVMLLPLPDDTPSEPERPSAWRDPLPQLRSVH